MWRLLGAGILVFLIYSAWNPSPTQFGYDLTFGVSGTPVTELQKFLQRQGLYDGPITGNFLEQTMGAVTAFQEREGIETTGYFGPLSRQAANAYLASETPIPASSAVAITIVCGVLLILVIFGSVKKRSAYAGGSYSSHDSSSSYDTSSGRASSLSDSVSDSKAVEEAKGYPGVSAGGSHAYKREGIFGGTYYEDDTGSRVHERESMFGGKYYEDDKGNKTHERESIFGGRYFESDNGTRTHERSDVFGNTYYEDDKGNKTYERTDVWGNKYYEKE